MLALKEFADFISLNMPTLTSTYARLLAESSPEYQTITQDKRLASARKLLTAVTEACQQETARPLRCLFTDCEGTPRQRWAADVSPPQPLLELECLGQTLSPVAPNLEAGKFLWRILANSRIELLTELSPRPAAASAPTASNDKQFSTLVSQDKQEHDLLQLLINTLPDHIYIKDAQSRFLLVNEVVRKHLGAPAAEAVVGKTDFDFSPPELAKQYYADEQALLQSGEELIGHEERIFDHGQDSYRWVLSTKVPFYDEEGEVAGLVGLNRDITDLKQAEERLHQANLVIENSPVVLFRWKATDEWAVEFVTKNVIQFGYTPDQFLSGAASYASLIHPDDRKQVLTEVKEHIQSHTAHFQQEYRLLTKDGQVRWVDVRSVIERDSENVTHFQGILIDITERKEAEELLRQSQKRYQSLYVNTPSMMHSIDQDGCIIDVSNYWLEALGYQRDEVLGQPVTDFLTEESKEHASAVAIPQFLEQGAIRDVPYQFVKKNGQIMDVLLSAVMEEDEEGNFGRSLAVSVDITERKRAEEQLQLTQFSIDNAPESIFWIAPDAQILYVNQGACQTLGYSRQELLARKIYDIDPDFPPEIWPQHWADLKETGSMVIESRHETKEGHTIPVEISINYLEFNGQEYNFAFARDITQRKRTEEIMAKRATELETVAQVSTRASTLLDREQLLQEVADLTKERFGLYHAHLYLLREETGILELAAGAGDVGRQMRAEGWQIPLAQEHSLVAQAARSHEGIIVNDVQQDPDFLPNPLLPETCSEMAVPMLRGDQLSGVLDVQAAETDYFSEEDVRIYTTLAAQITVALQNANLYEQTQRRAHREETIREITGKMREAASLDALVKTTTEELGRRFSAQYALLELGLEPDSNGKKD